MSNNVTPANVSGSVAPTPNSNCRIKRVKATAPANPMPTPSSARFMPCPITRRSTSRRAERHANADLVQPLRHRVTHHAVDADGRQQHRDGGKQTEQQRAEAGF